MGQVWSVPKAVVYRALPRLGVLGLIQTVGEKRTSQGPVRSLYQVTPAGQAAALAWLGTPAGHARDIRSELMVKLALLDRSGIDSRDLRQAQLARLRPVAAALGERCRAATGFEHTLVLWRHEAMTATLRFLEALSAQDQALAAVGPTPHHRLSWSYLDDLPRWRHLRKHRPDIEGQLSLL
jgi:PadR family transcriptional regulator AphA